MKSPLTCSAYHGRGKYYFNKTPNIHDETLNEYFAENKTRMSTLLSSLEWYLEDKINLVSEDLIDNILKNNNRFYRSTPTLIERSYVEKFIKLFQILLHKEAEAHQSTLHPILEMYSLMNEFYEKYFEDLRKGNFSEKLEKEFEEGVAADIEAESTDVNAITHNRVI